MSVVSGYGPSVCEDKGLNPFLVLATLAGAGLAFFIIYRQITTGGKRNLNPSVTEFFDQAACLVWSGKYKHIDTFLSLCLSLPSQFLLSLRLWPRAVAIH